jgi:hypothetical protein
VIMLGLSMILVHLSTGAAGIEMRSHCATKNARKAFDEFSKALRAQIAVAASRRKVRDAASTWHVFEDAWASPLVWERFRKFCAAMPLDALGAMRDAILRLHKRTTREVTLEELDGWSVESSGYVMERRDEL